MYINERLKENSVINIGYGDTPGRVLNNLATMAESTITCVSLTGGVSYYLPNTLSNVFNAKLHLIPAPLLASTSEMAEAMRKEESVQQISRMISHAELSVVGIGSMDMSATIFHSGILNNNDLLYLSMKGAKGDVLSHFLDGEGRVLDYPISGATPEEYMAALEDYLNGKTPEFQALLKQKIDAKETPAQPEGDQTYTVVFVDEEGNPVPEVMASFCTAEQCHQTESDEEGKCTYTGPADSYHVTIVEVPDGFIDDFNDDVYTEKYSSCSITIVLRKE